MIRKLLLLSLMLTSVVVYGQQPQAAQNRQRRQNTAPQGQVQPQPTPQQQAVPGKPERMVPEMTEIWDPEVPIIQPGTRDSDPPSDAIVLFNGTSLDEWTDSRGGPSKWIVQDGALISVKGAGTVHTKRKFGSVQLHIEWKTPSEVTGSSQGRGNSGVFMQELYEVQVLDSYDNRTYRHGQAGSLYKQHAPLVNVSRRPGEWQTYDIIYTAPTFNPRDTTTYLTPPRITVLHNGVLIQNNVSLRGPTQYIGIPEYTIRVHGPQSLVLQDHGNPVAFRNIWIREL